LGLDSLKAPNTPYEDVDYTGQSVDESQIDPRGAAQALYDDQLADEIDFSDDDEEQADGSMTIRDAS